MIIVNSLPYCWKKRCSIYRLRWLILTTSETKWMVGSILKLMLQQPGFKSMWEAPYKPQRLGAVGFRFVMVCQHLILVHTVWQMKWNLSRKMWVDGTQQDNVFSFHLDGFSFKVKYTLFHACCVSSIHIHMANQWVKWLCEWNLTNDMSLKTNNLNKKTRQNMLTILDDLNQD